MGVATIGAVIEAANDLSCQGQIPQAVQLYRVWIGHNADSTSLYAALFNCSVLTNQLGDSTEAANLLRDAIACKPDFMAAYINLGVLLEQSGSPEQALELWQTALSQSVRIDGNAATYATTALKQTTRVLSNLQHTERAEEAARRCLQIDPHQQDVVEQYLALRLANWKCPVAAPIDRLDRPALMRNMHPLSMLVYVDDPLLQLATAARYVRQNAPRHYRPNLDRRNCPIDLQTRRIRLGYVSSDLRDHAIGWLIAELFEVHDKATFEVFVYYCGPFASPVTNRIKLAAEHWIDIQDMTDDEAALKIGDDGIDLLVDINGHTRFSRLGIFARRPAPIQVNWLGYPGSIGSPFHHYIIADEWIIPADSEIYYSEKVVRLPCYQPNDRKRVVAKQDPTRSDAGLPDGAFVYCCFNGTHKISRQTYERWLEILQRVPQSVLWLLDTGEETKSRLREFAEDNGVLSTRLIFAPRLTNAQHLARYPLADLVVDTSPYGAHTTASDALWMGVPVLTLAGRSFPSRVCGSLVRSAGLADLVCECPTKYADLAVALGKDRELLEKYRATLVANRSTCQLFDTDLLVDRLEGLYRLMCQEHQTSTTPQPDLASLDAYLEAGLCVDHDSKEFSSNLQYHDMYRQELSNLHLAQPLPPDRRLWMPGDIALSEELAKRAMRCPVGVARGEDRASYRHTGERDGDILHLR